MMFFSPLFRFFGSEKKKKKNPLKNCPITGTGSVMVCVRVSPRAKKVTEMFSSGEKNLAKTGWRSIHPTTHAKVPHFEELYPMIPR